MSIKAWHCGFVLARYSRTMRTLHQCRCCVSCTCGCICVWGSTVCVCAFPGCTAVGRRAGSLSPPVLSLTSLIGPQTLCFHSPSLLDSPSTLWLCRQTGKAPGSPSVLVPGKSRHRLNQSRTENTDGPRLSGGSMENTGPRFPSFACCLICRSSRFCAPKLSVLICYPFTLASGLQSGLISFELHCV